jgi:hypothetical protein
MSHISNRIYSTSLSITLSHIVTTLRYESQRNNTQLQPPSLSVHNPDEDRIIMPSSDTSQAETLETYDSRENENFLFGFAETESMKEEGRRQIQGAIKLIPDDYKAAYTEAMQRVPHLVDSESDPTRFLRFEQYNSFAAARRLVTYWKTRKAIFGVRAFLPLDLSEGGALTPEDVALLNSGLHALLPNDDNNRSVWCLDRSKFDEKERGRTASVIFFLLSVVAENEVSQKDGFLVVVMLSNPMGATFRRSFADEFAVLIRKAFPLRLKQVHLVCCHPELGSTRFTETFVPMALQNLGAFFSSKVIVHIAQTDEAMLEKLLPYGIRRENFNVSTMVSPWGLDRFARWQRHQGLIVGKRAIVSASEVITNESNEAPAIREGSQSPASLDASVPTVVVPSLAIQQQGLSKEERDEILLDLYGSADVPFTLTKEIQEEGEARAQLQKALDLIDDKDKAAYLEARARVPHLIELESDPYRYLQYNNMDPLLSAKDLVTYWEKRKEIFGEKAFNPIQLKGRSALSAKSIELIESGVLGILQNDGKGRPILLLNRLRLGEHLVGYAAVDQVECGFYMMSLLAEKEESRSYGFVALSVYRDGVPPGSFGRDFAEKMISLLATGTFPLQMKALHFVGPVETKRWLENAVASSDELVGAWDFVKKRTVVHALGKGEDLVKDLGEYSFQKDSIPDFLGGGWHYPSHNELLEERMGHEKTIYTPNSDIDLKSSRETSPFEAGGEKSPSKTDEDEDDKGKTEKKRRDKKRKMDAVYARRKRRRLKIEIEVLQDQCRELGENNVAVEEKNKKLETLLASATAMVERHEKAELPPVHAPVVTRPPEIPPTLTRVHENPHHDTLEQLQPSNSKLNGRQLQATQQREGQVTQQREGQVTQQREGQVTQQREGQLTNTPSAVAAAVPIRSAFPAAVPRVDPPASRPWASNQPREMEQLLISNPNLIGQLLQASQQPALQAPAPAYQDTLEQFLLGNPDVIGQLLQQLGGGSVARAPTATQAPASFFAPAQAATPTRAPAPTQNNALEQFLLNNPNAASHDIEALLQQLGGVGAPRAPTPAALPASSFGSAHYATSANSLGMSYPPTPIQGSMGSRSQPAQQYPPSQASQTNSDDIIAFLMRQLNGGGDGVRQGPR